mgnify:CR=1 FL=1
MRYMILALCLCAMACSGDEPELATQPETIGVKMGDEDRLYPYVGFHYTKSAGEPGAGTYRFGGLLVENYHDHVVVCSEENVTRGVSIREMWIPWAWIDQSTAFNLDAGDALIQPPADAGSVGQEVGE